MSPRATSIRNSRGQFLPGNQDGSNPIHDWPVMQAAFLAHVNAGGTWAEFSAIPGHPAEKTMAEQLGKDAAFRALYLEARDVAADVRFEQFEALNRTFAACTNMVEVARLKAQLDNEKWSLSRRAAKRYGDRIDHTTNGETLRGFTFGVGAA